MGLAVGAACIALAVFLPGIGTVAAGALLGAGMGAISASVAGTVSDYSSGNVRSLGEATKDMVISMITGAITGAIGAAFPAVKWFGEGLIDVGSGILTRGMYALLNPDMSTEEKLAYVFDLKQMGVGGDTSWGAYPHQPYLIPAERMSFSFRFCPAKQNGVSGNRQYLNFK